jgi:hypothetical protein
MYATGTLLIVCGIPATIVIAILFMHDRLVHWSGSEACLFGGGMIAVEMVVAGALLYVAEMIAQRRRKNLTGDDVPGSSVLDR